MSKSKKRRDLYFQIAVDHTPMSIRCVHVLDWKNRRKYRGKAHLAEGWMECPVPSTLGRLWTYIHECAHMLLHVGDDHAPHRREFEAEEYTAKVFESYGLEPRSLWKFRIQFHVQRDIKAGHQVDGMVALDLGLTTKQLRQMGATDQQIPYGIAEE